MNRARSLIVAGIVLLGLTTVTVCAPSPPVDTGAVEQSWDSAQLIKLSKREAKAGHASQAKRLADGKVTFGEYQAAFNELSACLRTAGIAVSEPVISPVSNDRYEFTMDTGSLNRGVASKLSDECSAKNWTSVSQGYMFTRTPVMDIAVRHHTVACLEKKGMRPSGHEKNAFELAALPDMNRDVLTNCILAAVDKLYPGLKAVTVTF